MKTLAKFSVISLFIGIYSGCSPVKFSSQQAKCPNDNCVVVDGSYSFDYSVKVSTGKVDILIVNDNSASMSFEQNRLAPRFANFIEDLDNQKVDYRIAMITTDVTGDHGGKLIDFSDGVFFLTPNMANRISLFNSAIQRPETLSCEAFIANWIRSHNGEKTSISSSEYTTAYTQNCPSGDERGVYAANLVVNSNPQQFIRNDSNLSVIFISDEDERSGLYLNQGFSLEALDQPAQFLTNVKQTFGQAKYDSLTVHAIVVKDQSCLGLQNSQTLANYSPTTGIVFGSIGSVYLTFTNAGWGRSADICSNDYTTQLGKIRASISDKIKDIALNCSSPNDLIVTVSGSSVKYHLDGKSLKFDEYLAPGTDVTLSYKCKSLN